MFDLILFGALSHQIIVWSSHAHIDRLSVKIIVVSRTVFTSVAMVTCADDSDLVYRCDCRYDWIWILLRMDLFRRQLWSLQSVAKLQ